jgi:hypothetical protein
LPTSRPASCLPWAMPRTASMEKWMLRYHNCMNSSYSSSFWLRPWLACVVTPFAT